MLNGRFIQKILVISLMLFFLTACQPEPKAVVPDGFVPPASGPAFDLGPSDSPN